MGIDAILLPIERGLWSNDAVFYHETLTEDAILVFAETGAISRDIAVAAIREENAAGRSWADVTFADIRVLELAADAAMLTYRATFRWNDESAPNTAMASSVYLLRDGRWRLAFHQQTPLSPPP